MLGNVDELNSALGLARQFCQGEYLSSWTPFLNAYRVCASSRSIPPQRKQVQKRNDCTPHSDALDLDSATASQVSNCLMLIRTINNRLTMTRAEDGNGLSTLLVELQCCLTELMSHLVREEGCAP